MDVKRTLLGVALTLSSSAPAFAQAPAPTSLPPPESPPTAPSPGPDATPPPTTPDPPAEAAAASAKFTARTEPRSNAAPDDVLRHIIDRPHTIAELEAGIIALPTAPISQSQRGGDTPLLGTIGRGDATLQTGLHILYRWNRDFAVGAGALFAPSPTSDNQYVNQTGSRALPRTHSRSYFFLGGEGRYIPLHYNFFEAWVGLSIGGVVGADRFTTETGEQRPTILGGTEVIVRIEGFAIGVQVGGSYYLSQNWIAGLNLRAYRWILPEAPRCSAIGDCSTLSGTVEAIEAGLTIGYRLPL